MEKQNLWLWLLFLILLVFSSCRDKNPEILVYSDRPETIELINLFNQGQNIYTARLVHGKNQDASEIAPGFCDIVIAKGIHNLAYQKDFSDLNSFRETSFVQNIYPEILKTGVVEQTLKTIPLALDLPVLLGSSSSKSGKMIYWKDLGSQVLSFNKEQQGSLKYCGFSPLWSNSFLGVYFDSQISSWVDILEKQDFIPLQRASRGLEEWIIEHNGSMKADQAFTDKYRYIPDYRLILEGRIAFEVMPLSRWASLPDEITRKLSLNLLAFDSGLECFTILSAALPKKAKNPKGGTFYLNWLLEEENWKKYLEETTRNRDESFAFLGGISASEKLNMELLPAYWPVLKGKIPRRGEFAVQSTHPPQWKALWGELFLPLIRQELQGTTGDYKKEYRKWQLLHPDTWMEKED